MRVRAMLLTSSRADPKAHLDLFSDYDVILVVTDIHPFFEDRTWLQDFGQVLGGFQCGENDETSLFARFLAEKGGGVHHVAVSTPDFDEALTAGTATGKPLVLSGRFGGIDIAYLPTEDDLGVPLEVFRRRS